MSGTIVVGYVPTELGEAAVDEAARVALERNCTLVLVNASRSEAPYDPLLATSEDLSRLITALESQGIAVTVDGPAQGEDPADALLEAAQEHNADLIVIGLRNRSRVGKALFGSTAQRVLLQAPCSVLAAKLPEAP
ncbi:universal stress protein [Cellulosimicrobium funkei]|nr:universal stress protein [Cellulosimicrobium funkei]